MDWTRGNTIGQGSSGATVSLASYRHSGDNDNNGVFAVKSVEFSQSESLQREQKILSSLSCPHVIGYRGYDISRERNDARLMYNLFLEYARGGMLTNAIYKHGGGRLDESRIGVFTRQIVQGLEYLHSIGLVHCDIKGQNILIGEDGVAKIADFGCAKWVEEREGGGGGVRMAGTPLFMAPEVVTGEEQGCSADIWALGCTIIEMAGGSPWPNSNDPVSVLYRIGFSGEMPIFPDFLSNQTKDFLGKCLSRDPKERWTASELLQHPFLCEFDDSLHPKQLENSNSNSPISILDKDFWNSFEDSSSSSSSPQPLSQSQINPVRTILINSPVEERMEKLSSMFSEIPRWDCDEKWITIRNNNSSNMEEVERDNSVFHYFR